LSMFVWKEIVQHSKAKQIRRLFGQHILGLVDFDRNESCMVVSEKKVVKAKKQK